MKDFQVVAIITDVIMEHVYLHQILNIIAHAGRAKMENFVI